MGIIPARAGFTQSQPNPAGTSQDHPRSRGVYRHGDPAGLAGGGSSPLARGLPARSCSSSLAPRIIPARAGFTWAAALPSCRCQDHPRSRGVYLLAAAAKAEAVGSSPLARGLPFLTREDTPSWCRAPSLLT